MIKTLDRLLTRFEEHIVALALLYSVFMISLSVILRALGHGIQWSDESVRYIMIMTAFVGCSLCVKRGAHISIDILQLLINKRVYRYIDLLINIISCLFTLALTMFGLKMISHAFANPQLSPALQIPMWVCYLTIPFGFGLTSIRYLAKVIGIFGKIVKGEVDDAPQALPGTDFNV